MRLLKRYIMNGLIWKTSDYEYFTLRGFFRNYPYQLLESISFAANNSLPQRPYIVRFIIFNLLFVPSTKSLDKGLATAFSTADKSFSSPEAKRDSSFKSLFLYFSINSIFLLHDFGVFCTFRHWFPAPFQMFLFYHRKHLNRSRKCNISRYFSNFWITAPVIS